MTTSNEKYETSLVVQSAKTGNLLLQKKNNLWQIGAYDQMELFSPITSMIDEIKRLTGREIMEITYVSSQMFKSNFHLYHSWIDDDFLIEQSEEVGWFPLFGFPQGDFHPNVDYCLENRLLLDIMVRPPDIDNVRKVLL